MDLAARRMSVAAATQQRKKQVVSYDDDNDEQHRRSTIIIYHPCMANHDDDAHLVLDGPVYLSSCSLSKAASRTLLRRSASVLASVDLD